MPSSSRDFLRAALCGRVPTAKFLLKNGYNLDAMYLGGYAVECSLKALILEITPEPDQPEMLKKISSGKKMHDTEILGVSSRIGVVQFPSHWSSGSVDPDGPLRFDTDRVELIQENAQFVETSANTYDWVKEQLP